MLYFFFFLFLKKKKGSWWLYGKQATESRGYNHEPWEPHLSQTRVEDWAVEAPYNGGRGASQWEQALHHRTQPHEWSSVVVGPNDETHGRPSTELWARQSVDDSRMKTDVGSIVHPSMWATVIGLNRNKEEGFLLKEVGFFKLFLLIIFHSVHLCYDGS